MWRLLKHSHGMLKIGFWILFGVDAWCNLQSVLRVLSWFRPECARVGPCFGGCVESGYFYNSLVVQTGDAPANRANFPPFDHDSGQVFVILLPLV